MLTMNLLFEQHWDTDERQRLRKEHEVSFPVLASILYLSGGLGGPTLILPSPSLHESGRELTNHEISDQGALIYPEIGSYAIFRGNALHGTFPWKQKAVPLSCKPKGEAASKPQSMQAPSSWIRIQGRIGHQEDRINGDYFYQRAGEKSQLNHDGARWMRHKRSGTARQQADARDPINDDKDDGDQDEESWLWHKNGAWWIGPESDIGSANGYASRRSLCHSDSRCDLEDSLQSASTGEVPWHIWNNGDWRPDYGIEVITSSCERAQQLEDAKETVLGHSIDEAPGEERITFLINWWSHSIGSKRLDVDTVNSEYSHNPLVPVAGLQELLLAGNDNDNYSSKIDHTSCCHISKESLTALGTIEIHIPPLWQSENIVNHYCAPTRLPPIQPIDNGAAEVCKCYAADFGGHVPLVPCPWPETEHEPILFSQIGEGRHRTAALLLGVGIALALLWCVVIQPAFVSWTKEKERRRARARKHL